MLLLVEVVEGVEGRERGRRGQGGSWEKSSIERRVGGVGVSSLNPREEEVV